MTAPNEKPVERGRAADAIFQVREKLRALERDMPLEDRMREAERREAEILRQEREADDQSYDSVLSRYLHHQTEADRLRSILTKLERDQQWIRRFRETPEF